MQERDQDAPGVDAVAGPVGVVLPRGALMAVRDVVEAVYSGRSREPTVSATTAVVWVIGSVVGITTLGGAVEDCDAVEGETGSDTDPAS